MQKAHSLGLEGASYPNVNAALEAALHKADKQDLVLVCGSVFVVAEVEI
jgi:dihydrofolate synthase/folylpolyglutamate synthase